MLEEAKVKQTSDPGFSPREQVLKYIRYLPWLAISVALLLILAYIKLRYSTPIYNVSAKLLVSRNNPYSGDAGEKFGDIFMMQNNGNNLSDQMEIIRSRSIAERVIKASDLQVIYYNQGKVRASAVYSRDMPFQIELTRVADSSKAFSLLVTVVSENQFVLNNQAERYYFNQDIDLGGNSFRLSKTSIPYTYFGSNEFVVNWRPLEAAGASLSSGILVSQIDNFSNVLGLSYATENTRIGLDVVNHYMQEFQKFSLEDKKLQAENALAFINEQLDTVKYELGKVEQHLQNFKETNNIFDSEHQSTFLFDMLSESATQLTDLGVKTKVVDYLINYISDKRNPYRIVPAALGIEEPSLAQQIIEFNKLQLERATSIKTTTLENPYIKTLDAGIEKVRDDMLANLYNVKQSYVLARKDLEVKNLEARGQIKAIPGKEKRLLEVAREQRILQELYSFLLQKKLETSISSASTISNITVLEPAMASEKPISPNRRGTYLIAIFIGIIIPVAIIALIEYLNDKVKSKQDVARATSTPILGEIGHSETGDSLIVTRDNREYIAEQFRIIRSNLQYILPKKENPVILVTSSFSGEGKSFISTNLGAVMAISGKKTVILEFDIRKPKILKGLGLKGRKGITNYIVGDTDLYEIIQPITNQENLYVIPCGPVPPNPAEILLDDKINQLFVDLRKRFDVIIVDTAPVGLVSDAITLGKNADSSVYIVRHNYTYKKLLQLADELYTNNRLPHLSLVINDINSKGGYGGYYGYGYGYGYGYSSDAYFSGSSRKKSLFKKIESWIRKRI